MKTLSTRIKALEADHQPAPSLAILIERKGTYKFQYKGNEFFFNSLHEYQDFYNSLPDQPSVLNIEYIYPPKE